MTFDSTRKIHFQNDDIPEKDLEEDVKNVKVHVDGVMKIRGQPYPSSKLVSRIDPILAAVVDELGIVRQDDSIDEFKDNGRFEVGYDEEYESYLDKKKGFPEAKADEADNSLDFDQFRNSSSLQNMDDNYNASSPHLGVLNEIRNKTLDEVLSDEAMKESKKGKNRSSHLDHELRESSSKPDIVGESRMSVLEDEHLVSSPRQVTFSEAKGTSPGDTATFSDSDTTHGRKHKFKTGTSTPARRERLLKKLNGRRTNEASIIVNDSIQYFDYSSVSNTTLESVFSSSRNTTFKIGYHGDSKLYVHINGSGMWKPVVHGKQSSIDTGSIIVIIGVMVLAFSLLICAVRNNRKPKNNNNNISSYQLMDTAIDTDVIPMAGATSAVYSSDSIENSDEENMSFTRDGILDNSDTDDGGYNRSEEVPFKRLLESSILELKKFHLKDRLHRPLQT